MIIFVDVDQTLCYSSATEANGWDYTKSIPMPRMIEKINKLKKDGHTIVIWTARGSISGKLKEALEVTTKQMKEWGVCYDEIKVGKPYYDLLIDDKTLNPIDGGFREGVFNEQ